MEPGTGMHRLREEIGGVMTKFRDMTLDEAVDRLASIPQYVQPMTQIERLTLRVASLEALLQGILDRHSCGEWYRVKRCLPGGDDVMHCIICGKEETRGM